MKTLTILITAFLLLIVTIIFAGCKKYNDQKKTCRITTADFPLTGAVYKLSYNSNGQLSSVTIGDTVTTYTYAANTIIATSFASGKFSRKSIITLNAEGMASNVRTEIDLTGNNWHNKAYEYNGTELIKSTLTLSAGTTSIVATYTWLNGNMVSVISGSVTNTFDYYPDKVSQGGPAFNQSPFLVYQLIQGYEIYRTKNLLKSIDGETFAYDFRPDGNISSVRNISGNASSTIVKYQYQCEK
ncbi:MAG: hypothetical protein ABI675_05035 [Chitinophagaceae bacterium]